MARGVTLIKLLNDLRAACRISLNVAHNKQERDPQLIALQQKQEWFWNDFAWPHLRVERVIPLQAGQRFYSMPEDLDIDRINKIEVRDGGVYEPLQWGVGAEHYAAYDSDLDQRSDPAMRVQISEDEQLEVWPLPQTDADPVTLSGNVKITGIRKLKPLVADTDRADLDDQLLILHCAAEYLASTGAKDAQVKLDLANARYLKLRSGLMPRRTYKMFDTSQETPRRRDSIVTYKAT